ncbi:hypothetical protein SUGI_1072870 [Cryptomeria japonica]|uniref:uncharacterized protein At5g19025 n=1 Tax=Cryptomeria japonica TaxID=3369 RepID=UPI002414C296|nr:uncharacterized protein At5g19025 [Cryptomeria japonica]XP_057870521.1 uncharacterized protein At5g19025 [Cryptomeria japonica]GLJ50352.1 hypothetical protein SUGI_1072870 [Cryptomeria japonica]
MVDCRGLIEFCKAFEQHRNMANSMTLTEQVAYHRQNNHNNRNRKQQNNLGTSGLNLSHALCEQSSTAVVDIVILLLVLGACGFLFTPYFKYVCREAAEILPATFLLIGEVIYNAPIAYASGAILMFLLVIGAWEIYQYKSRKCENPHCRGLRKAVEFDIQLESEECVKALLSSPEDSVGSGPLELGQDHKELEAELRRMAPPNGRAVLIFRAPCGCPAGRMEVWGPKKLRKSKK